MHASSILIHHLLFFFRSNLAETGHFSDPVKNEVQSQFMPWVLDLVSVKLDSMAVARSTTDSLLQNLVIMAGEKADQARQLRKKEAEEAAAAAAAAAALAAEAAANTNADGDDGGENNSQGLGSDVDSEAD
jgi:hypothetical protein